MAQSALSFYAAQTGITVSFPDALPGEPVSFVAFTGTPYKTITLAKGTRAVTLGEDQFGNPNTANPARSCVILIRPEDASRATMAHEAFHCVQLQVLGNADALNKQTANRGWVTEGAAAFAACQFTRGDASDPEIQEDMAFYRSWINTPALRLLFRTGTRGDFDSHTGVGFWGLLQQAGVNALAQTRAVLAADSPETAYSAAISTKQSGVEEIWASSLYEQRNRKPSADWVTRSPCRQETSTITRK